MAMYPTMTMDDFSSMSKTGLESLGYAGEKLRDVGKAAFTAGEVGIVAGAAATFMGYGASGAGSILEMGLLGGAATVAAALLYKTGQEVASGIKEYRQAAIAEPAKNNSNEAAVDMKNAYDLGPTVDMKNENTPALRASLKNENSQGTPAAQIIAAETVAVQAPEESVLPRASLRAENSAAIKAQEKPVAEVAQTAKIQPIVHNDFGPSL